MELGHMIFGNISNECNISMDRTMYEDIWYDTLEIGYESVDNDVFIIRPYCWDETHEDYDKPNFVHKPSGFKMSWYKYPLRDSYCNMNITPDEFREIMIECMEVYNG